MKKSLGSKTLIYPTPVWVVGTYSDNNMPNVMTIAWGGICCSQPPCVSISLRKATFTYGNIIKRNAFTISVPSERYVKEADYFGMVSGKDVDKFAKTGLTAIKSDLIDAPYVKEFPLILECKVINTIEIGLHTQFIGEIVDVKADEEMLSEKGNSNIDRVKPIIFSPDNRSYYGVGGFIGNAFSIGREL